MKTILLILLAAVTLSSCTDEVCCSVSKDAANDALYEGQTELCYGDPDVSNRLDKDEWVIHMERLGCKCY
mgnify:CR=1 FL=1|jgi:PBP1b-binding outer membrane lipoprotein LpoB